MSLSRAHLLCSVYAVLATLLACGGGGGGGGSASIPPPTLTSSPTTSAVEGHPYRYTAAALSPNGGTIQFTLVAAPTGAALNGTTLDWTPVASMVGTSQAFKLRVDDGKSSAEQSWTVTVSVNRPPVFQSTAPASAQEGRAYSYTLAATDPEGDAFHFVPITLPAGATLTGNQLSWTPVSADAGRPVNLVVRAVDALGALTDQGWTITPSRNLAPVFLSTPPVAAKEGHTYTYTLVATDPDGDPVHFVPGLLPTGASLAGNQFSWTPIPADTGRPVDLLVKAIDALGASTDQAWRITPNPNASPVVTSHPPDDVSFVHAKPVFDYVLTATDADQDIVSFTLVQAPIGATLVNGILHWAPTPDQERVPQTFQIRTTDGCGGVVDQQWTKAYSGVLRGTWMDVYQAISGSLTAHMDPILVGSDIKALLSDGVGGFKTIHGAFNVDGTLSLPGIPTGPYWLSLGPKGLLWTDKGTLDVGTRYMGRPDLQFPTSGSFLSLTLGNLDSWSDSEGLVWQVPNHAYRQWFNSSQFSAQAPAAGDTALASAIFKHMPYVPLVEAAKNDTLTLLQETTSAQGDFTVRTIQKSFTTDTLTEASGVTTPMMGAFTVPPEANLELRWDVTPISAFLNQIRPDARLGWSSIQVSAQPGGLSQGWLQQQLWDLEMSYLAHPFLFNATGPSPAQPLHQTFRYRDPYPATWSQVFIASTAVTVGNSISGNSFSMMGNITVISDSPGTPSQPLAPLVSPVQHPTLNGQDFFADLTGLGTTPVLTWEPPAFGSPVCYLVRAISVIPDASGGASYSWDRNSIMKVFGTSVQIPPGVLTLGSTYMIDIRAMTSGPGYDPAIPGRFTLPMSFAPCISGVIQP